MNEWEREYLGLTLTIMMDYDGAGDNPQALKRLLDEVGDRIKSVLDGKITSEEDVYVKE